MSSSIEKAIARNSTADTPSVKATTVTPFPEIKRPRVETRFEIPDAVKKEEVAQDAAVNPQTALQFDLLALAQDGYLTPETMQGSLAEQYRLLKHSVLTSVKEMPAQTVASNNLIAITSAVQGEGKTFTSFNLAMSLATERDLSVLLVDGDLIGRSLSQMTGLNAHCGLNDALQNPVLGLDDIIVKTNVPRLELLPAGKSHQHATELISSERMREFSQELAGNYQIVLFDAPPLLLTSLTIALVDLVGQVLVVVEEGRTPQNAVMKALSLVAETKHTGIVLNKCRAQKNSSYY